MKVYPAYKDSDVEWIGEIPEHWHKVRLKFICEVKARLGWRGLKASEYVDDGYVFLSTPNIKGETINFDNVNYISKERFDESPEIILEEGYVLLAKDGSTLGTTNVVRELPRPSTVNSSIAVLKPSQEIDGVFLYHYLSGNYIQNHIAQIKDGMGVPHLFQEDIREFLLLVPPEIQEQKKISDFIERKTAQIDTLVEKKQRQIDLLQEERTALINDAVTKGLNPGAPMRDSGVKWIGKIPVHWKVPKFKHIATVNGRIGWRGLTTQDYVDDGIILLGVRNISNRNNLLLNGITRIPFEKYEESPEIKVQVGDVLLAKTGATIGKSCVIKSLPEPMTVNAAINIFRVKDGMHPEYLNYLVTSNVLQEQIWLNVFENARGNIFQRDINELTGIRPPYEEQVAIADYIEQKSEEIFSLIDKVVSQIELIQEYRTALISAAVTGKIDLR